MHKSHDYPAIQKVYESYPGKPGNHVAHEVSHTSD
ncbi:MAG: iron hydrogenase small subunit [Clostridiales bacterium]|nr:iron hydrogenase small subunit [Clostridiales bacterium]